MKASFRFINLLMALALAIGAVVTAAPPQPVQAAESAVSPQGNTINACGGIFISEYVEGTSSNKALEIYNGTGVAVDLAGWQIIGYHNGLTTPTVYTTLTGLLAHGDTLVVCHPSSNATLLSYCDVTTTFTGWYNGDDAITLVNNASAVIDSIGIIGTDPGSEWGTGLTSTADNTLRRKSTVSAGDTNTGDAFDPAVEWDGYAADTFGGLGTHTADCGAADVPPAVSTTVPDTDATGVALDANIRVTFSEAVTLAVGWYTISCGTSGAHTAVVDETADPVIVLNPADDFAYSETCTVSLEADFIVDEDGTVDNMAADYAWSFTTTGSDADPTV
ncbi:MAG TPA: Ig-like domain-containing protein, partial [Anaerolineaceae bacterium]|nr:Ig-like domain-containing protein [Anaerolineaceae bacterium]